METPNRPTGRKRRVDTTVSGNAHKRGSGFAPGQNPFGGSSGPSGHSGSSFGSQQGANTGSQNDPTRMSGSSMGILALLAYLLLGKKNGNGNKRGCLGRILIAVLIIAAISYLSKSCSTEGLLSGAGDLTGGLLSGQTTSESLYGGTSSSSASSSSSVSSSASQSGLSQSVLESILSGSTTTPTAAPAPTQAPYVPTSAGSSTSGALDTSMFRAHEPDRSVSTMAREKYTTLRGRGQDDVTIMIYMCATDLEAKYGMATKDLNEILSAKINDEHVNIIVETGGCQKWQNNTIPANRNMIYRVSSKGLEQLVSNLGKRSMVDPENLSSFIRFCASNYPANRNILILWDHGGGSLSGYGYDQLYANDTMTLNELDKALTDGGVKFDIVGFDACLMATLETALVAERTGDYLLASEAVEPGTGWYYTDWITALSNNTSIATTDLAKIIIDDFIDASTKESRQNTSTLSLIDLAELNGTLPSAFRAFSTSTSQLIETDQYAVVSKARAGSKNFSTQQEINQIDLMHFASQLGTDAANGLIDTLRSAVKYNRTMTTVNNAYGVSVYFPKGRVSTVNTALKTYEAIGMDEEYSACIRSFASIMAAGQATSSGTGSVFDVLTGGSGVSSAGGDLLGALLGGSGSSAGSLLGGSSSGGSGSMLESLLGGGSSSGSGDLLSALLGGLGSSGNYTSSYGGSSGGLGLGDVASWFDTGRAVQSAEYISEHRLDASRLTVTKKGSHSVLSLTDKEWALIDTVEKAVFVDDGEGYVDLGLDNVPEYDADGDLILDFDGNWFSIGREGAKQVCPVYFVSFEETESGYQLIERVPAYVNDERVEIVIAFTEENEYGTFLGAQPVYEGELTVNARGLYELQPGDRIDFVCSFYGYDGSYQSEYLFGDPLIWSDDLEIWDVPAMEGNKGAVCTWRITDIYGNQYFTPALAS